MQLGKLKFVRKPVKRWREKKAISIDANELKQGVNALDELLVYRLDDVVRIYDRICDHNGGRLITNGNRTICPLHGWDFDATTGEYLNVNCTKAAIYDGPIPGSGIVTVEIVDQRRAREAFSEDMPVTVRFLNHACLVVETDAVRFATDPWLVGSAFCNGWWLAHSSPADAFDVLNECDFIYISHNHPDHLHAETLHYVRKDIPILTADFVSGSTVRYLRDLGFQKIHSLSFTEKWVAEDASVAISLLKSGDFRDDSGIFIEIGKFSAILTVDSNFIDFWQFPKGLDLLASSFAGGASGFPLCFDNYTQEEKERIVLRNRNAIRTVNKLMLQRALPSVYLPYAGFFKERAQRDAYVAENNLKNSVEEYEEICTDLGVFIVDPVKTPVLTFFSGHFTTSTIDIETMDPTNPESAIASLGDIPLDATKVRQYFEDSKYLKPLDLLILPTDDSFTSSGKKFFVQFYSDDIPVVSETCTRRTGVNYLEIKVRENEFARVIAQGLPWEDLSIGFQCRIYREPNVYNSDFWYHFSNVYISDRVKTRTMNCAGCEIIDQSVF
jgi:CMP-N-acetylneuraminate monooxygenase